MAIAATNARPDQGLWESAFGPKTIGMFVFRIDTRARGTDQSWHCVVRDGESSACGLVLQVTQIPAPGYWHAGDPFEPVFILRTFMIGLEDVEGGFNLLVCCDICKG